MFHTKTSSEDRMAHSRAQGRFSERLLHPRCRGGSSKSASPSRAECYLYVALIIQRLPTVIKLYPTFFEFEGTSHHWRTRRGFRQSTVSLPCQFFYSDFPGKKEPLTNIGSSEVYIVAFLGLPLQRLQFDSLHLQSHQWRLHPQKCVKPFPSGS